MGNRVHGDSPGLAWCLIVASGVCSLGGPGHAEEWNYLNGVRGRGYVICDAILKRLNNYEWTRDSASADYGVYVWSVVAGYPGWKQPPWQDLDSKEHRALIKELYMYEKLGADAYFGRSPPRHGEAYVASLDAEFGKAMQLDHRLRLWRTHLFNWLDGKPVPPGDQAVISLSFPFSAAEVERLQKKRPEIPIVPGQGRVTLVTDDLRGPDPRLREGMAAQIGNVLLFDGKVHFVSVTSTGWDVLVRRNTATGPSSFCELVLDITEDAARPESLLRSSGN